MNNRTGIYIRLSQMDEYMKNRYESESVESQRMILTDYAKEHNFNIVKEYVDDGYSGTNFDRPAFKEMMEDLNNKVIDTVMVKDLSRFGRDHIQTGYFIETYFPQKRIRFVSLLENLDSALQKDYSDSVTFVMACNDYLSKQNSLKIRTILDMKKREGKFVGSMAPYGYIRDPKDKGHLIPDFKTAPIVKEIFKLAFDGKPTGAIAKVMNEKGYITPSKNKNLKIKCNEQWNCRIINKILTDQVYVGDMIQSKSTKASYKSNKHIKNDKSNWIIVKNTHEPLVKRSIFNALGNPAKRSDITCNGRKKELLENIIYCKDCCGTITLYRESGTNKIRGDCCAFKRSKTRNKSCFSHYFDYSIFKEKVLNSVNDIKNIDKNNMTRKEIQKIVDAIFIDSNRVITIIFKDKKTSAISINYND